MARPKKATVDYFPHMTEHGKTLYILESRWGNDGYAVWFKLLERIGASDGLYLDCRDATSFMYLAALARVTENTLLDILDVLASLDAIDRDLWRHKLVFCQHLVDNVADAFRRRKEILPTRENVILCANIVSVDINGVNAVRNEERERERERESIKPNEVLTFEVKDQTKAFMPVETVDKSVVSTANPLIVDVPRGLTPVDNPVESPQTLEKTWGI